MTREQLIATANRITELREKIAELSNFQKELRKLEASLDELTGEKSGDSGTQLSIEERVGQLLESNANREWDADEISRTLGTKIQTTRAALSKLRKASRIIDTRRGYVQAKLKSEFTTMPKQEDQSRAA